MTVLEKLDRVEELLKHQPGRHDQLRHDPHKGAGKFSDATVSEALKFVQKVTLTGTGTVGRGDVPLSQEAQDFLAQTVEKDSYTLYRGLGLVKGRPNYAEWDKLSVGDEVPDKLLKTGGASYTKKKGVAHDYAEGKIGIVMQTKVPAEDIVVDLENLPKALRGVKQDVFDEYDFDYFKEDKEVLVAKPGATTVVSTK